MAKFYDIIARLLVRKLAREQADGTSRTAPSKDEVAALVELSRSLQEENLHLRANAEKRKAMHQGLKKRLLELKAELKTAKASAREARHEAWRKEAEMRKVKDDLDGLSASLAEALELPGCKPLGSNVDEKRHRQLLRHAHTIWKYPMRLGVLRQHEPKPRFVERFPVKSNGASSREWPTISVTTPSYQQAAFLERTLASVLEQGYPRLDYHVMDGGSVDGSVEVLQKHASRLASWASEKDSGPASAINRGFARSQGEIMAWLNSDDLLMPGAMHYVADYFMRHPEVDVVYGHRLIVDERDWQVGHWVLPRHNGGSLLWADYIPQETMFWRRRIWDKAGGGLDESFKFAFDWDLLLRFQKAGARIVRLPRFMGCFRVHDAQKSTADISTVGMAEMERLRSRELAHIFNEERLSRHVVNMQRQAIWYDRLIRLGVRL